MRYASAPDQHAAATGRHSAIFATCVALLVGLGWVGWFAALFLALR